MQQEVILKEQEIELLQPKQRYECSDCHKLFTHIEHCKDKKDRCRNCKRKQITNKWYNPLYDKKIGYIGKFNVNSQEYKMLISKYLKQGYSYNSAKYKVNYDLKCMQNNRLKKIIEVKNLELKKEQDKELNKKFLEGLGQCKKK